MPIYEFICKKCGHRLEQLCKMGEKGDSLVCPHCGSQGLHRKVSGFSSPGVRGGQDKCAGCSSRNCNSCQ